MENFKDYIAKMRLQYKDPRLEAIEAKRKRGHAGSFAPSLPGTPDVSIPGGEMNTVKPVTGGFSSYGSYGKKPDVSVPTNPDLTKRPTPTIQRTPDVSIPTNPDLTKRKVITAPNGTVSALNFMPAPTAQAQKKRTK